MKEYILTSTMYAGEMVFMFDDKGRLKGFKNDADLQDKQIETFLTVLPKSLEQLQEFVSKADTRKLSVRGVVVTFEMFWNKYDYKTDKAEAIKIWDKMKPEEQYEAYDFIDRYNSDIKRNSVARKYVKTYLRQKPWIR